AAQRGWCQLVWLAGAAQCGEQDEIAAGQPVRLEDPVHRLVYQCGDAGDAAQDARRGHVEVGSLALPLFEDCVDGVCGHSGNVVDEEDVYQMTCQTVSYK